MLAEDLHPSRLAIAPTFIETLAVIGGQACYPERHWARMWRTLEAWASTHPEQVLAEAKVATSRALASLSAEEAQQKHRLTLTYSPEGLLSLRLIPYVRRQIQRLVPRELPPDFDYRYKYADRSFFLRASEGLAPDEEPLFYRPDGLLTDTTFTNVILDLPRGLVTPRLPLLAGTQRASLLAAGLIREADLRLSDLLLARAVYLINALLPLEEAIRVIP